MGKKRIATIDLSQEEKKPRSTKASRDKGKKSGSPGKTDHGPAKPGKQHGRITDMGAVMLEEMEKREKAAARKAMSAKETKKKAKKKKAKKTIPTKRVRSQRYQTIKKLIKPDQFYPLSKAITILKKTANAKFEETVILHLIVNEPGKLTKNIKTEAKTPLAHIKIGKTSLTKKKLEDKIQALLKTIGLTKIKQAVLTSTMGPGIKLDLSQTLPQLKD